MSDASPAASASEKRRPSVWSLDGAAELSGGFEAVRFQDGWESGGLLAGKGDAALGFQPSRALRLRAGPTFEAESGTSEKYARGGGRFLSSFSPVRPLKVRADVSAAIAEGEDPFRDCRSARARGAVELDLIPASFLVSGGYGVEADDFFRIGRTELIHRAFAEAVWIPSVTPLTVFQAGIFGETLRATIEGDRRSSPGATLAADLETLEGFALSFSGEYRYDLFESGVRAHAVLLTVRLRAKISENLFFLVEYGLDSNGSSSGSEAFFAQRAAVGFRVAS